MKLLSPFHYHDEYKIYFSLDLSYSKFGIILLIIFNISLNALPLSALIVLKLIKTTGLILLLHHYNHLHRLEII